ncbi:MAG: hypothetical protein PWP10_2765 [Clostridiales bacterium]|jgi:hypothetical protein|nr:hypothetical protein [Clostridiales bacterium]
MAARLQDEAGTNVALEQTRPCVIHGTRVSATLKPGSRKTGGTTEESLSSSYVVYYNIAGGELFYLFTVTKLISNAGGMKNGEN